MSSPATSAAASDGKPADAASAGGQPLNFSEAAATKVKALLAEEDNAELKLRVFVAGGGCSGFQYGFTFDENQDDDDIVLENYGVTLLVDSMSLQYLTGAEIDYQEKLEGSQFVIHNPNVTSTCGCGSSFSV
ncbi:MAG: iron-sulfur cluster insertion protein ErpA [Betaproteobacteria bacterium AqS2]|uniref:Iron-sulfur cluster insertion protein ErpA n=1 Tax=Candidatus Amphirhobacter heronislandensis TaxID=1732024 RepID=A0A930UCX9_9GAMM|nr:iron-sulfur cluster insertion protein ErpA [Betaproteobacteria bacterium AqS2]